MKKRPAIMTTRNTSIGSVSAYQKNNKPNVNAVFIKSTSGKIFVDNWKSFWAFAGPILSVLAAGAYWWPSVILATGANLDPRQAFQTQFVVTNNGHVPVRDVSFVCALVGGSVSINSLKTGGGTASSISVLKPGEVASRGCFLESAVDGPMLRVDAYYRWPVVGLLVRTRAYFLVRRGAQGAVLVPEATPFPEPPVLMQFGSAPSS